jgi:hypothetical protein
MNIRWPIVVAFVFVVGLHPQAVGGKGAYPAEQSRFSAEDESVQKPVAVPQDVLTALTRDSLVRAALKDRKIPAERIPASWFSASAIHLGNARETDLIVMAVRPVHGVNATKFWAFRPAASGHELVFTGGGHDLRVRNTRRNGYRDIEALGITMLKPWSDLYRFDGKRYIRYNEKVEEIR